MRVLPAIKDILSDKKTLGLALLVSLCLHLLFIRQIHWRSFFSEVAPTSVIETRLIVSKPSVKPNIKKTETKRVSKSKPAPAPEPKLEPLPEPFPIQDTVIAPATEAVTPLLQEAPPTITPDVLAEEPPVTTDELPDEALAGSPYQQVVTEFAIYLNAESQKAGRSTITFNNVKNEHYTLTWSVEATGLLGLFYPNLVQISEGNISPNGLQPTRYQYQFGDKKDKSYQADFDWENRTLTLKSNKGDKSIDMASNTQDMLSFMYQFMYVAPLNEMRMSLTNGKKMNDYDYAFEGEETLTVDEQAIKTLHIAHSNVDNDEKTELWLAVDYRYIPVKIKKTDKKGMVIEQVATHIATQPYTN